jgi:hypothetical protein
MAKLAAIVQEDRHQFVVALFSATSASTSSTSTAKSELLRKDCEGRFHVLTEMTVARDISVRRVVGFTRRACR